MPTRFQTIVGALGTIVAAIAAAIIAGLFGLISVPGGIGAPPPSGATEPKLLGVGFGNVEGPIAIEVGASSTVALTISLKDEVLDGKAILQATPDGQPAIKAEPVGTINNLQNAELLGVQIYSLMSARLDAPAFDYIDREWVEKEVLESATWLWNLVASDSIGPQAATVSVRGPNGSAYEQNIQLEIQVLPIGSSEASNLPVDDAHNIVLIIFIGAVLVVAVTGFVILGISQA